MSKQFQILIKSISPTIFTGVTTNLSLDDNYFSYNQSGLNQGVVTEFNVRQFLDDPRNQQVSSDFFNYLTSSTDEKEFREITESNLKLAIIFQKYYNTSILSGSTSPTSFVDEQLTQTKSQDTQDYYRYNLIGAAVSENSMLGSVAQISGDSQNQIIDKEAELVSFSIDESYYINFQLSKSFCETTRINFIDEYSKDILGTVERSGSQVNVLLKQEFVVIDNLDKNSFWKD